MSDDFELRLQLLEQRLNEVERRNEKLEEVLVNLLRRFYKVSEEAYSIARHGLGDPTDSTRRFAMIERVLIDYLEKEFFEIVDVYRDAKEILDNRDP